MTSLELLIILVIGAALGEGLFGDDGIITNLFTPTKKD